MGEEVLKAVGLIKKFGEFVAVNKVTLSFRSGERTALIGPNGAGKTTLINLLSGHLTVDEGRVLLKGKDVTKLTSHKRVKLGLNRTFQIPSVFKSLTVKDNLRVASSNVGANFEEILEEVEKLEIGAYLNTKATVLPYGLMKELELMMVLSSKPDVILLDEPTAGLTVGEKQKIVSLLERLPTALTLVIVEHDMDVVFKLSKRIVVMNRGEVIADGPPEKVAVDEKVREVYLG